MSFVVEQEERSVRKSFIGNPMSILDLYQHSLYGHYGEDGPEQLTHYSFIEQLSGTSSKDGKNKDIPSVSYFAFTILPLPCSKSISHVVYFSECSITIY